MVVLLLLAFSISLSSKAQADVYGYILKISVFDSGKGISSGDKVPKADILGNLVKARVTVYDPSNPTSQIAVSEWDVSISSLEPSGHAITTPGGTWSLNNVNSSTNPLTADLKLIDKESLGDYYSVINARATVSGKKTNSASFKIIISDKTEDSLIPLAVANADSSGANSISGFFASLLGKLSSYIGNILSWIGLSKDQILLALLLLAIILSILILPLTPLASTVSLFSFGEALAWGLLWFIPFRTTPARWGRVLEMQSEFPLSYARVMLLNPKGQILMKTRTNRNGIYGFRVKPGEYLLKISKGDFQGISGEKTVELKATVRGWQEESFIKPVYMKLVNPANIAPVISFIDTVERLLRFLLIIVLITGIVFYLNELIQNYNDTILVVAIAFLAVCLFSIEEVFKKKQKGKLTYKQTGRPIPSAVVRFIDAKSNKLLKTAIANKQGEYSSIVRRKKIAYAVT